MRYFDQLFLKGNSIDDALALDSQLWNEIDLVLTQFIEQADRGLIPAGTCSMGCNRSDGRAWIGTSKGQCRYLRGRARNLPRTFR